MFPNVFPNTAGGGPPAASSKVGPLILISQLPQNWPVVAGSETDLEDQGEIQKRKVFLTGVADRVLGIKGVVNQK